MNENLFEINYSKYIEPIYTNPKNRKNSVDSSNEFIYTSDHKFKISFEDRVDMTMYETYSIDPVGCKDADDAFSIFKKDDKLYLAIHIADPTDYINIGSDLWLDIVERTTTKYPSNRNPIHMMPDELMELSSLMVSDSEESKICKAITILSEINNDFYLCGKVEILFTKILVKKENALNYNMNQEQSIESIEIGLKISEKLKKVRSKNTKGVKLNELSISNFIYSDINEKHCIDLYIDSKREKLMKQMIAEFAIFANSFVGEYLKININTGIFRTCNAKDFLKSEFNSGEEMIREIITNGITADYLSKVDSHDLVGMPEYCHFTSPIRRLADCICHYLIKSIYFKYDIPFSQEELDNLSKKCLETTKKDKKNQYLDTKFRLLQYMNRIVNEKGHTDIEYYLTGYSGLFLNLIICKIDNHNVHMSYTLRVKNYGKEINPKVIKKQKITKINCFTKFDQNCIPELDNSLLS